MYEKPKERKKLKQAPTYEGTQMVFSYIFTHQLLVLFTFNVSRIYDT